ncbi:hypothetical protein [Niabella drilacis]|uniref:Uncharacterized protein n=1 Tax=Niabella drilacis (strain DSM 25811 / CCM 8410 / CCUG 62505 / LMG 26954 / E90) TaxID=1285928 RepID=A0A1G6JGB6_NIADE|nr:hypothetical protein [Niabella drilacis]SDC17872.1 hypothetical protein SAMN04487894_101531 [Niabella drilacis]
MISLFILMSVWGTPAPDKDSADKTPEGGAYTVAHTTASAQPVAGMPEKKEGTHDVGLFYFTWLGQHPGGQKGIYNISQLLQTNPEALYRADDSRHSPLGQYHFWGEPLYGYYNSADPWVITRHIELLTMAGIDYLMLDATNSFYYPEVVTTLLDRLSFFRSQGWPVPKIAFYTNSASGTTVSHIYKRFYASGKHESCWYSPGGKPLIIGITEHNRKASDQTLSGNFKDVVSKDLEQYFDVREAQWPTGIYNKAAFPWISWDYPQRIHKGGVISVSVAQHGPATIVFSDTLHTKGRGYDVLAEKNTTAGVRSGKNYQSQWETVFKNEKRVNNVFITGWNEWVAIKMKNEKGIFFVDAFNEAFSRDIEMMKDGYGDDFYLQTIANIRKFKYNYKERGGGGNKTRIRILDTTLHQWNKAAAWFQDFRGDAIPRNFAGFAPSVHYWDSSARNDIVSIKVTNDKKNLYILVETALPVTAYNVTDRNWMNILLSTGHHEQDFGGFSYIVNRRPGTGGTTSVERSVGSGRWSDTGKARMHIWGNHMQVSIPLRMLKLNHHGTVGIKVADNVTRNADIMDYYITGDSAPIGRLAYLYSLN